MIFVFLQCKQDREGAEEYYSRAILADPNDGDVLSQYGKLVWEVHHDQERASSYFERAVQASPEDRYVNVMLWRTCCMLCYFLELYDCLKCILTKVFFFFIFFMITAMYMQHMLVSFGTQRKRKMVTMKHSVCRLILIKELWLPQVLELVELECRSECLMIMC